MKATLTSLLVGTSLFCTAVRAQTLFTYGNKKVSKNEFLTAFNKNNNGDKPTAKAYQDYLDLYVKFRLKVQAAYDQHLDTLPNQSTELQNFRNQIIESYMTDEESLQQLVSEAFTRSQKDIHLAHIFIPLSPQTPNDTSKAYQQAMNAWKALEAGQDFGNVAAAYSADPSVRINNGDLGYITVFTLPYALETLAYATLPGAFSKPLRTKSGYHIFKNVGEQKAQGTIHVAQILLAFEPGTTAEQKETVRLRADSLYRLLKNGAPFGALAAQFSHDNASYTSNGVLAEFGVGHYEAAFEKAAFGLSKDGDISQPVLLSDGYHIIQRLGRKPVPASLSDAGYAATLKQLVTNDARMLISKQALVKKALKQIKLTKNKVNTTHLWQYADSAFNNKKLPKFSDIQDKTVLFSFNQQKVTVGEWSAYLRTIKNMTELSAGKGYAELLQQYIETKALEYYREHLEAYHPAFAQQLQEFKDGNLLFEAMQRNIWDKAAADTAGLKKYYSTKSTQYWWEPSADVVLFTGSDETAMTEFRAKLEKDTRNWRALIMPYEGRIQADSGRYETAQLPLLPATVLQPGTISATVTNVADKTFSYLYVINNYPQKAPRNYEDARGFVLNDYQNHLEAQWIEALKKKYPVKINEPVLQTLVQ